MIKKRGIFIVLILGVFFLAQNLDSVWLRQPITRNWGLSFAPDIASDTINQIHVVWEDDTPGNNEIFYKKSTDGGANWSGKWLTWSTGRSEFPAIAVDSNNHLHVVWNDDTPGNHEIFYKKSTNSGANWSTKRLSRNSGHSVNPDIALDSNNHIHVVWEDASLTYDNIFYNTSTDGGINWSAPIKLTFNYGLTLHPAITLDSNNYIHVVWAYYSPVNAEIFYIRKD